MFEKFAINLLKQLSSCVEERNNYELRNKAAGTSIKFRTVRFCDRVQIFKETSYDVIAEIPSSKGEDTRVCVIKFLNNLLKEMGREDEEWELHCK